ncbi:MAG: hypothetical protein FJW37_00400, partial [Acidobacteria bacterium]|nr:hypothetical protein [Acidobacteriota bacterium]
MKPGSLDRRSLLLLGLGVGLILVLRFGVYRESGPALVAASVDSVSAAERRLEKLRQIASTLPGKRAALNQAREELAGRERGLIRT